MTTNSSLRSAKTARMYWRRSSYSGASGTCVEVAHLSDGGRAVRDAQHPAGPTLMFSPSEWSAFTAGVRVGEFD